MIATTIRQKEEAVSCKEFLSVQETADHMGVKRNAIYQLIYRGKLKAYRITSRVTRISRKDIEDVLSTSPYVIKSKVQSTVADENGEGITEFYTTKEIIKKFGVSNSWVFAQGKAHNIPKVYHRGKTLWSKVHCDRVFTAKPEPPKEDDWISYSEVRAEYNLTHDQLYNYVKYHGLRRKKVGKYTYVLRSEIDAILRPPTRWSYRLLVISRLYGWQPNNQTITNYFWPQIKFNEYGYMYKSNFTSTPAAVR